MHWSYNVRLQRAVITGMPTGINIMYRSSPEQWLNVFQGIDLEPLLVTSSRSSGLLQQSFFSATIHQNGFALEQSRKKPAYQNDHRIVIDDVVTTHWPRDLLFWHKRRHYDVIRVTSPVFGAGEREKQILLLASDIETRFQIRIMGFRPWRARSAHRRTWPEIGSSRIQHGGTKTGSRNNSACVQHWNTIPSPNHRFSTMANTFRSSPHMADNRINSNSTWRHENRK